MDTNARIMPERDRNEETGQFVETFPRDRFLTAIQRLDLPTTTEVAEAVGCDRRTAYVKLRSLVDDNQASSRKVGQTLVWSPTSDASDQPPEADV
jgi:predicted transcriptional regulator